MTESKIVPLVSEEKRQKVKQSTSYTSSHNGIYYQGFDKNGQALPPLRLSDNIQLIGRGVDKEGRQYRVVRFFDCIKRESRIDVIPCAEIGTNQGWCKLQGLGLAILANKRKRELLSDYLQCEGSNEKWTITSQSGWINNHQAYILPNGEILQSTDKPLKIIYNGIKGGIDDYRPTGSLEDWRRDIGRYIAHNSRLQLAIGASLAPVLMRPLSIEAGGFHLFGDSRTGKSTLGNLSASVWGKHDGFVSPWRGTGLGFENLANSRNDGLLVLDEINEAKAHVVEQVAYSVINGRSKIQGAKEGGNRERNQWRVMMFSTGEKTLEGYTQSHGGQWQAGQAARLPSIPADAEKGYGVYDTLHDAKKGSLLSESIDEAIKRNYGLIGRAFVQGLIEQENAFTDAKALINQFIAQLPETDGQARTVALRFALVFSALVMATRLGVLELDESDIFEQIKKCFDAWLEREGTGKREDKTIIGYAVHFMEATAHSHRFVNIDLLGEFDHTPHDLAGYKRRADEAEHDKYFILDKVFKDEICQGYDANKVCKILYGIGWLKKYETSAHNRWKTPVKIRGKPTRLYLLVGSLPECEDEEPDG